MPVSHLRVRDFCFSLSKRLELRQALRFLSSAGQWSAIFMDEQRNQKPLKISPRFRHAHSFRILSWNSASTTFLPSSCSTCLFTHLTHWKFQCIASEPEIFRQIWFVWAVHKHFRWVLRSKLMTSLIISLLLAVFYQQSLSCEVINNSQVTSILPTGIISLCAFPGRLQLHNYFSKFPVNFPPQFSVCKFGHTNHFILFVFQS